MKARLTEHNTPSKMLISSVTHSGWTLVIGAGISMPIFPSWNELVKKLIKKRNVGITDDAVEEIMSTFGADALIQASYNLNASDDFPDVLADMLYENLRLLLNDDDWQQFCKILTSNNASFYNDTCWIKFITFRDRYLKNTISYELAKFISEASNSKYAPSSIISFNAESLLYALINSFKREGYLGKATSKIETVNMMTSSVNNPIKYRIPYYFCHGAIFNGVADKSKFKYKADSKLVFSESQYLHLANNTFSWQSNAFLSACTNTIMIFVGVSLSDPNMRKWLTWVQNERSSDIGEKVDSTKHFWVTKKPQYIETMDWMEAAVLHLGVRIIWVDEWANTVNVIKRIIGYV